MVRVAAHVGTRVPFHSTALGEAFLAFTPRERIEEMLDRHGVEQATSNTGSDGETL